MQEIRERIMEIIEKREQLLKDVKLLDDESIRLMNLLSEYNKCENRAICHPENCDNCKGEKNV